jgi:hypothetical protein
VTKYWPAAIGGVFVLFVLVAPRGIVGAWDDLRRFGIARSLRRRVRPESEAR